MKDFLFYVDGESAERNEDNAGTKKKFIRGEVVTC